MPVLAGAEPFTADGHGELADVGVLLVHGFTGSPQSLRPWGEFLAAAGLSIDCPRLPGHGTRWQDLAPTRWEDWYGEVERHFDGLRMRCRDVFVMGLSMGATLSLRLAEQRGSDVSGLVVVNASLTSEDKRLRLLPLLKRVVPSLKGPGNDVKAPGVTELAYQRMPLQPLASLTQLWKLTRADLSRVVSPLLAYRSADDHVVEPVSGRLLLECISSTVVEERVLHNSYHVATLDNDAPTIFAGSLAFVRAHACVGA